MVISPAVVIYDNLQWASRLKACRYVVYKTVPVIIQEFVENEDDKLRRLIAANSGRLKNNPIKQSKLITEYEKLCGVTQGRQKSGHNVRISQEDIAKQLGVDTRTLRRLKELQNLSPDLQEIISSDQITPTTGFKILAKLSESEQEQLLSILPAAQKLTQAQVQEYLDQLHSVLYRLLD